MPRDQWASDAGVELEHFSGIDLIVWSDPSDEVRFARTPENPRFDYRPGDEEWQSYVELVTRARQVVGNRMLGPFERDDGSKYLEIVVAGRNPGDAATLAAIVDVGRMFDAFLTEESPGFAVQVFADDELLYSRGTADAGDAPESWTRDGLIRSSFGTLWRVVHLPTADMVDSFSSPAVDLSLLLGLIVAVLLGTLVYENGRARTRAFAAERAEARVSDLNRALEHLVEYRTKELAERSADLQTLTDSVAHDLRNPLNNMSVNIQLLEEQFAAELGPEGKTVLERLPPCIGQMTDVLDRLLGLSTVANATFERERVSMKDLAESTFADLAAVEPSIPVNFIVGEIPDADADPTLTHILLTNLLSNALKYSRESVDRTIRVEAMQAGNETIYSVSDNGIGFRAGQAERIFDAFERGTDNHAEEGLGLGLTLARKVVSRHEGRIWAVSEPGEGATFFFTLAPPADESDNRDKQPAKE